MAIHPVSANNMSDEELARIAIGDAVAAAELVRRAQDGRLTAAAEELRERVDQLDFKCDSHEKTITRQSQQLQRFENAQRATSSAVRMLSKDGAISSSAADTLLQAVNPVAA